jgi:hypothetical protein
MEEGKWKRTIESSSGGQVSNKEYPTSKGKRRDRGRSDSLAAKRPGVGETWESMGITENSA